MAAQDVLERCLEKSAILSRYQMPGKVIPLGEVLRVLTGAKVSFVLVGAHGLAGWRKKPRATEDVDVVVALRQVRKAVQALQAAFPKLESVDLPVVVRLRDRETHDVAIDVMKPLQQPYREIFRHAHVIEAEGLKVRIPSLEMALVMKFSAMTSLYRAEEDKLLDAHDFICMVKGNPDYDRDKLALLGSLLYPDGGKDVVEMARKALAGEKLHL
jgi:predicted nucleotidyltransferase